MQNVPHLPLEIVSHIISFLDPIQQKRVQFLCKRHKQNFDALYPTLLHLYHNKLHRLKLIFRSDEETEILTDIHHNVMDLMGPENDLLEPSVTGYVIELYDDGCNIIGSDVYSLVLECTLGESRCYETNDGLYSRFIFEKDYITTRNQNNHIQLSSGYMYVCDPENIAEYINKTVSGLLHLGKDFITYEQLDHIFYWN